MCVVVAALPQQTARQKLTESGVLKQKEVSLENYGGVKKGGLPAESEGCNKRLCTAENQKRALVM